MVRERYGSLAEFSKRPEYRNARGRADTMIPKTETHSVYVSLLNEGTDVWRPVSAIRVAADTYVLLRPSDYDPEDEDWEFLPGEVVVCEVREMKSQRRRIVAISRAGDTGSPSDRSS